MMTQEEYVEEVLALRRQGWDLVQIAAQMGYHPQTISNWLDKGGPPAKRSIDPAKKVIDERWALRTSSSSSLRQKSCWLKVSTDTGFSPLAAI